MTADLCVDERLEGRPSEIERSACAFLIALISESLKCKRQITYRNVTHGLEKCSVLPLIGVSGGLCYIVFSEPIQERAINGEPTAAEVVSSKGGSEHPYAAHV